jgi:hypothetical protein
MGTSDKHYLTIIISAFLLVDAYLKFLVLTSPCFEESSDAPLADRFFNQVWFIRSLRIWVLDLAELTPRSDGGFSCEKKENSWDNISYLRWACIWREVSTTHLKRAYFIVCFKQLKPNQVGFEDILLL